MRAPPALDGAGRVTGVAWGWMVMLGLCPPAGACMLGAGAPFRGAPTATSQRWPGCPCGGLVPVAAEPVAGAALVVITGGGWLVPGAAVMPGRGAGAAALELFLPEPELQAANNTLAIKQVVNNLYMQDDLAGDLSVK